MALRTSTVPSGPRPPSVTRMPIVNATEVTWRELLSVRDWSLAPNAPFKLTRDGETPTVAHPAVLRAHEALGETIFATGREWSTVTNVPVGEWQS